MRLDPRQSLPVIAALFLGISYLASVTVSYAGEDPQRIAVFDFELQDTSLEGEMRGTDAKETQRLHMISHLLRQMIDDQGGYTVADTASMHSRLEAMPALYSCNGCEVKLAAELGADYAMTGFVRKISTLILYVVVSVRDVKSDKLIAHESVSIRGNSDESWSHGLQYLVRNRLAAKMASWQ